MDFRKLGLKLSLCVGLASAMMGLTVAQSYADFRFIQVAARNKQMRSAIANLGVSIEAVRSDSVWGFANTPEIEALRAAGFQIMGDFDVSVARGGHGNLMGFPPADQRYHTYSQMVDALKKMNAANPDITRIYSIGKSLEGRDIPAIQINTNPQALAAGVSNKPGAVFMGNHHAREHLSLEVPLMLAQYLLDNRRVPEISNLLDSRDIWIIPTVNPDGAEFDIASGQYRWWRKNRRNNGDGTFGVDLNRNYSYKWGQGGSSHSTDSDIYMGSAPFSEPETQAVREFTKAHLNAKVQLSFHTYSELILYPWGYTYDPVVNQQDHAAFVKAAQTMAQWNHYTPEQSSELYITTGDTTDWGYGEYGLFAFTFELSPRDMSQGGFYPGAGVIDKVFADNLKPCLYLLSIADNPHKILGNAPTGMLRNYVEPRVPDAWRWQPHPVPYTQPRPRR